MVMDKQVLTKLEAKMAKVREREFETEDKTDQSEQEKRERDL